MTKEIKSQDKIKKKKNQKFCRNITCSTSKSWISKP